MRKTHLEICHITPRGVYVYVRRTRYIDAGLVSEVLQDHIHVGTSLVVIFFLLV